jgi:hypothetical protein
MLRNTKGLENFATGAPMADPAREISISRMALRGSL